MSTTPFTLDAPSRFDLSTYIGRVRHFQDLTNPMLLLTTDKQLEDAVSLLRRFREGSVGPGRDAELWKAKAIRDGIKHPDTGETIFPLVRLSAFVPMNVPICAGMILTRPTLFNTLFWQWFNQSFNAGFNYANRNASSDQSTSDIMTAYTTATVVSCTTALALGEVVKRATSFSPAMRTAIQRTVPYTAVAAAGAFNAWAMRRNELTTGIEVRAADGTELGRSQLAAKKAITEVVWTRIALPLPILLLPPYVMSMMEKLRLMPKTRGLRVMTELTVITVCLLYSFPAAIGLFPQEGSVRVEDLEPQFQGKRDKAGVEITEVVYNKGV